MLPKSLSTQIAGLLSLAILLLPAVQPGGWVNTAAATGSDSHPLLAAYCGRSTAALQARTLELLGEPAPPAVAAEHCPLCLAHFSALTASPPGLALAEFAGRGRVDSLPPLRSRPAPRPRARAPPFSLSLS